MAALEKFNHLLVNLLTFVGGVFLVGMIVMTCANVFLRMVWVPIPGVFELMGYAGAIATAFALSYTQMKRTHIAVDILVNGYSARTRKITHVINSVLSCAFFVLAAWQITHKASTLMRTGEVTETLQVVYYPFTYAVALGCGVLALTLFTELIKIVVPQEGGKT
jgi:TRAP-type C4-dicarboxylate transport system permease small subunit